MRLSPLLYILAIAIGLYLPQGARWAAFLVLPALTIALTAALLRFPGGFFKNPRTLLPGALWGNLMNYLILGNLIILGGVFLIRHENFWIGLVLIAAVPSALAVLPLSEKLCSDQKLTLTGFAGTYLGALLLIPLLGAAFLKYIPVHYEKLIIMAVALILLPLLLSRVAVDHNWDEKIHRREGAISDACFFIIFYAAAAGNARLIRQGPSELIFILVLAFASIVLISVVLLLIGRFFKLPRSTVSSLLLLGTMKNYGLAAGISIYVFNNEVAVPALIFSIFIFLNSLWLRFWFRR
ncbi:MAG: bile acid:sodium symporter [Smithellaceae bacterium]|nr:bile acid:sodium symporter [Smithellaceae bacterium]